MNPENPNTTFPIVVERWKSREELRREYLDSLSPEELRQVDSSYTGTNTGCPHFSANRRANTIPISRVTTAAAGLTLGVTKIRAKQTTRIPPKTCP